MANGVCTVCAAKVRGLIDDSLELRRIMEYAKTRASVEDADDFIEWVEAVIGRNAELSAEINYLRDFAE